MFKSKGKYNEFGGVMIEGLVATSLLIMATFSIIEIAGHMKSNADISRILQQVAVGASQMSSCTSIDPKYDNPTDTQLDKRGVHLEYLPDSLETFEYLQPLIGNSPIKDLAVELIATNSLKPEDYVVEVDFFADGITLLNGLTQIRTGYFWIGIKAKEKSNILGLIDTKPNCHTLLAPLPLSFEKENPSRVIDTGIGVEGCPDMRNYIPYLWKSVADSIDLSDTFCERAP